MSDENIDYKKLGVKAGLEIHQQLDADGKKLFCNCPSVLRTDEPDFVVKRKLHAVAGESGEVDVAAMHEALKDRDFVYQCYEDTTCLVELDEEPPHLINKNSLKIALQIALLMNMKIIPISQIMRKTVIDGSNTSGFQRTVLVARDGFVETSEGRVGIDELYLEEDAARIIQREKDKTIFRLDRLGVPLVEVATAPDLKTPEQIKEAALKIGGILRSTNVKRGIGTIRQDLNISTSEHPRVEIKGFQDPKMMVKTIEKEIQRQRKLGKKGKPEVRNALPFGETRFLRPMPGSARMYPETDLPLLKISRNLINEVKKNLPKLREKIEEELKSQGLSREMIKLLLKYEKLEDFKEFLGIVNNPNLIVKVILTIPREIAARENLSLEKVEESLHLDSLSFVLESLKSGKISEGQLREVLNRIVKGESPEKAIEFEEQDMGPVEEKIMKIIKEKPGLSEKAYMGLIMNKSEFRGKISGKDAIEIIKKYVK